MPLLNTHLEVQPIREYPLVREDLKIDVEIAATNIHLFGRFEMSCSSNDQKLEVRTTAIGHYLSPN